MSLLMEALRKAEEAKNKAAKEEKTKSATQSPPAQDSLVTDSSARPEAPDDGIEYTGPVVINPDPDEEEILSLHAADSGNHTDALAEEEPAERKGFELQLEDFDAIDYNTQPGETALSGQEDGPDLMDIVNKGDDDSLSLQQSGYFSRISTNVDRSVIEDDEFDEDDFNPARDTTPAEQVLAQRNVRAATSGNAGTPAVKPATTLANKDKEREIRDSAGSLFLAKQDSQRKRMKKLASIAAVVLVFPVAGGMYWFYTQMTADAGMGFSVPTNPVGNRFLGEGMPEQSGEEPTDLATALMAANEQAAATAQSAGEEPADTTLAIATEPAAVEPLIVFPVESGPGSADRQIVQAQTGTPPAAGPANPVQQPVPPRPNVQTDQTARTASPTNNVLAFVRSDVESRLNPDLSAAYDSYKQGDFAIASRLYQQVLASEPVNRDAMLGLASVYVKQNNISMAQTLYARLLELNPRDPLARAGLLDAVQGDPVRQEAELKALIKAYPGIAPLAFALGNLYAAQNRWNEAQGAYFDALLSAKTAGAGPLSPDYAFNLAVSLERINQLQPALEYYRQAAAYARNSAPGFDPAQLQQRLNYLEQRLP